MLDHVFLTINAWMMGDLFIGAVGCLLWGMVSVALSPCHIASIPLIVSYVAGQERALETKDAALCAVIFSIGLFITIATLGIICSLLGSMLGQVSPYWTILVGALLLWIALDIWGVSKCSMSGSLMGRIKIKGLTGAFVLGLAYGILSGSCTFGFIAPILAIITIQQKVLIGIIYIVLFGIGHCIPIAVAGSSTAKVRKLLESSSYHEGSRWFKKCAAIAIGILGIYFVIHPFLGTS
ncbi:MAG: cytochrome c biogenesis protein CcdA [Syntrophobacteraceae bacterium]|nr:cytochrome c biogenesis protein CcdA [Syntrophobacteraceae bacterium]